MAAKNAAIEPKRYVVIRHESEGKLLYGIHAVTLDLTDSQPLTVLQDCGEAVRLARSLSRRRCPFTPHYSDPCAEHVARFTELLAEMAPNVGPYPFEYQHVAALCGLAKALYMRMGGEAENRPNLLGDVKRRIAELTAEVEQMELDASVYETDGEDDY